MKARKLFPHLALLLAAFCLPLASPRPGAAQAGGWVSVRSENFLVVGHVGEAEARQIAFQLERCRSVLSQLLAKDYFDATIPTTAIVFRNDSEYEPFKPLHNGQPAQGIGGHFLSSPDISYITLSADARPGDDLGGVVSHEYVHSLVRNKFGRAPLWFNEGLAEYYSTLDILGDGQRVRTGKLLPRRIDYLRTHQLLPLRALVEADHYSPYYNEHDQRGIFYAQSWALVHYLLSDRNGNGQEQLSRLLELLTTGASFDEALRQVFKLDAATLESELNGYIRLKLYQEQVKTLPAQPSFNQKTQSTPITEAEAQGYLGDLLLRADRLAAAETYLQTAAKLDPQLAPVQTSLGILRLRENNIEEAKAHLQRALAADPRNYLAHYYLAELLRRETPASGHSVAEYVERTRQIREELKKSLEFQPDFLNASAMLISVDIERNPQLDEAQALLKQAMTLAPYRQDFRLLLAQIHLRREEFVEARQALEQLMSKGRADLQLRTEARTLLSTLDAKEEAAARRKAQPDELLMNSDAQVAALPCDMPEPGPHYKPLRFAGQQVCGRLVSVECFETGVVLNVEVGERTLKLRSDALKRIRFVTYTSEVAGRIECGPRPFANLVLITYRQGRATEAKVDGEVIAVEFVPQDWSH